MKQYLIAFACLVVVLVVIGFVWSNPKPVPVVTSVSFVCDGGKKVDAQFTSGIDALPTKAGQPPIPTGSVSIVLSDARTMILHQTISADGARYANADESFVFWNKGNAVMVQENNTDLYTGCITVAPAPADGSLPHVYSSGMFGFSLRTPDAYSVNESYTYQKNPTESFKGVKFTVSAALADGTNLGHDTYIAVETAPTATTCSADLFLDGVHTATTVTESDTTYSVASAEGAGAGNRYLETVYAITGSNPCIAVRYFVHYSVFQNYPPGTVTEFDQKALTTQFDAIRHTLVLR